MGLGIGKLTFLRGKRTSVQEDNAQTQELDWFQQSRKVLGLPEDLAE